MFSPNIFSKLSILDENKKYFIWENIVTIIILPVVLNYLLAVVSSKFYANLLKTSLYLFDIFGISWNKLITYTLLGFPTRNPVDNAFDLQKYWHMCIPNLLTSVGFFVVSLCISVPLTVFAALRGGYNDFNSAMSNFSFQTWTG